ncbi:MAG: hydroxyacid dehydrogenase [Bacillota bacterium]
MKNKVLLAERIHPVGIKLLEEQAEVHLARDASTAGLLEAIGGMAGLIIRSTKLENEVLEAADSLKVIGRHGIGLDNIDVPFATQKGIAVVNAPTANVNSVAEHVIAMMLALTKKLLPADQALRAGDFAVKGASLPQLCQSKGFSGIELEGKTLGLIGFGKIGSLVAKKCVAAFAMKVLAFDPPLKGRIELPPETAWAESKEELLAQSDFVSLHLPLTPATRDFIGEAELALMKPSAYLINAARGGVVNEDALVKALKAGTIAGAGLDVFAQEPPDHTMELFRLPNVIVSPHAAAMTEEALQRMAREAVEGVLAVLRGESPFNLVNPAYRTLGQ